MSAVPTMVIGSAGRRLYLVDWFRDAFAALGIDGRVVVTEHDPTSSSAGYGDLFRPMPRYEDPAYGPALLDLVDELGPRLLVSVNDLELVQLHVRTDLAERLRRRGVLVPGVRRTWQEACADKLLTARLLQAIGVPTPATVLGGDREGIGALAARAGQAVVKHRRGSGSSGLAVVPVSEIASAVALAARSAPTGDGSVPSADDVVVQPLLAGVEHGVDIVGDLHEPGELRAVLARRKLRMRSGETDKAVAVDPDPFRGAAAAIARAAHLTGLIDVDMFLEDDGTAWVIDINPRFGGGYPFVHLAGADVPRFCLAQAFGRDAGPGWQDYVWGTVAAKHEGVRVTGRPAPR